MGYESDAVGIQVYDMDTGITTTLLKAETDWAHSPNSLYWSKDGTKIYFTADVRSRQALCFIDSTVGASAGGQGITILRSDASTSLHGEFGDAGELLTTVQSLTMPSELFSCSKDGATVRQLTHFN